MKKNIKHYIIMLFFNKKGLNMFKKITVTLLLFSTFLLAQPSVTLTDIEAEGDIKISILKNSIGEKDWIAIYPKNASNAWSNVIMWKWVKDLATLNQKYSFLTYQKIFKAGEYQVRYFENNSFTTYKAFDFTIKKDRPLHLKEMSVFYTPHNGATNFSFILTPDGRLNSRPKDWVGLYKKSDSNAWGNVLTWAWARDFDYDDRRGHQPVWVSRTKNIHLQNGEYEVRYFKNNTFTTYKKSSFNIGDKDINLRSLRDTYYDANNQKLKIELHLSNIHKRLNNNPKDWVGVYEKSDSNSWNNVISWAWVKDFKVDENAPIPYYEMSKDITLKNGEYEVRYFKNNTFQTYKNSSFTVQ